MSLLTVENVNYSYEDGGNRRYILSDVSATFERGKFYAILGESGSGKTTFMSLISALDKPESGQIQFEGQNIADLGLEHYRRNHIGIIFQAYNLIPFMTALENVQVSMSITDNQMPGSQEDIAQNLLNFIGITPEKSKRLVNQLSGGEQQRVAIARALATNVDLILADEPTGNLNEEMEGEIVSILKTLAHEHNKCIIVVTHSNEIAKKADVALNLKKGQFVA